MHQTARLGEAEPAAPREAGENKRETQDGRDLRYPRVVIEHAINGEAARNSPAKANPANKLTRNTLGLPLVQVALLQTAEGQPQVAEIHDDKDEGCCHREHPGNRKE